MMPSNHLALLAMLALGYLGLLSTHVVTLGLRREQFAACTQSVA
jgi:hypothetical protein